jgi:hypothetical protein
MAKVAEQAERYEETSAFIARYVRQHKLLDTEGHNLLSVGFKNVVGRARASWRILEGIKRKECTRYSFLVAEYRVRLYGELCHIFEVVISVTTLLLGWIQSSCTKS